MKDTRSCSLDFHVSPDDDIAHPCRNRPSQLIASFMSFVGSVGRSVGRSVRLVDKAQVRILRNGKGGFCVGVVVQCKTDEHKKRELETHLEAILKGKLWSITR